MNRLNDRPMYPTLLPVAEQLPDITTYRDAIIAKLLYASSTGINGLAHECRQICLD